MIAGAGTACRGLEGPAPGVDSILHVHPTWIRCRQVCKMNESYVDIVDRWYALGNGK